MNRRPAPAAWERLHEFFDEEADGYLRFRRSLLRDAAYEGLPYKLRRQLHGAVAARMEEEMDQPDEAADILSLHYLVAGEYPRRGAMHRSRPSAPKRRMRTSKPPACTRARSTPAPAPREYRGSRGCSSSRSAGRILATCGRVRKIVRGVRRCKTPCARRCARASATASAISRRWTNGLADIGNRFGWPRARARSWRRWKRPKPHE